MLKKNDVPMIGNSTFLFIMDYSNSEGEIVNVDEMLDPWGKCSKELENTFKGIDLSPRQELISNILSKA